LRGNSRIGADVLEVPTSKSRGPRNRRIVDALLGLNAYDWLVFTSANGVTAFFDIFFRGFRTCATSARAHRGGRPATAAKLRELHLQVD